MAMKVTREEVLHCARLTSLPLEEEEIESLRQDMERLLSHAQSLGELDLEGVEPMCHGLSIPLPRRTDEVKASLSQEEALSNAPEKDKGHFLVPKVL